MLETLAFVLIGVGLAFDLFGCVGLIRLPDVYNRAQAATKCVTLGTCAILVGVAIWALAGKAPAEAADLAGGAMAVKALLCAAFILLTSPVAAHAICRGAYLSGVPLWEGSVADEFADRAAAIRHEQPVEEGRTNREEA